MDETYDGRSAAIHEFCGDCRSGQPLLAVLGQELVTVSLRDRPPVRDRPLVFFDNLIDRWLVLSRNRWRSILAGLIGSWSDDFGDCTDGAVDITSKGDWSEVAATFDFRRKRRRIDLGSCRLNRFDITDVLCFRPFLAPDHRCQA
ncbi:hypothetical protein [Mesorhizobium sp.]|uniref:hypothetical protein n=1 Tax=Mesorhizobium sp. TaxID=1871066 RepID=UPI0025BCFF24|nr:hypothetical protein [Mesorhizobium sp.]